MASKNSTDTGRSVAWMPATVPVDMSVQKLSYKNFGVRADFLVSISYHHLMIKLLSVSVFVIGSLAMGQDCSNATLRGAYAYASDGTATDDGKTFTNSEVGRVVFDGAGKLTARVASTTNGVTTVADAAGEYLIGSDCTMTGRTPDGLEFDGVVVNSGADFFIMLREPGLTRSGAGTKIEATGACSTATLNSSFGYFAEGTLTVDGTVIGLGELGLLKFDGAGGVTGVYSASSKGLVERKTFTGRYEVAGDCTATATFKIDGVDYLMNYVVASSGNAFALSISGGGSVLTGQGARQVPR